MGAARGRLLTIRLVICEKREKTVTASRRTLQRGPAAMIGRPPPVRKRKISGADS